MLTTAEGLAAWFGTDADIDLVVGGERTVAWGDGAPMEAIVDEIDPPTLLRLVYVVDGVEMGAEEWVLSAESGTTRLTLIHSMPDDDVDDWEGFYGDIRRGWRLFMASLTHALERAAVPTRHSQCRYVPAPGSREDVFSDILGALGPVLGDDPQAVPAPFRDMDVVLVDPPHSLLLVAPDRSLLVDVEGSGADQVIYLQAATHGGNDEWPREVLGLIG